MRLISKFHDYYDTALAQGQDDAVLFLRQRGVAPGLLPDDLLPWMAKNTRGWRRGTAGVRGAVVLDAQVYKPRHDWKPGTLPRHSRLLEGSHCWYLGEAFVLIAGKAHPVWLRSGTGEALAEIDHGGNALGGTNLAQLVDAMTQDLAAKRPERTTKVEARVVEMQDKNARHYDQARQRLLDHDFTDLHLATEAPVLLLAPVELLYPNPRQMPENVQKARATGGEGANSALILNPRLADIGFQRAVDPFTCFQAISQFIEGVVPGQQMPMVAISDASQVRKKGFDPVYGFRKRPATDR